MRLTLGWIHIIKSKEHFEELKSFIFNNSEIYLGVWAVFDGSLLCKDGRVIGKEGEKNFVILTNTFNKAPIAKMVEIGLTDFNSTVELDDLMDNELEDAEFGKKVKKAKYYKKYGEFKKVFDNYLDALFY